MVSKTCQYALKFLIIGMVLISCSPKNNKKINPDDYKESLIQVNKYLVTKDYETIKSFTERRNWNMEITETGLWYHIRQKDSIPCSKIESGNLVTLNYRVSLLDGNTIYSSDSLGQKTFKVGYGGVEAGLEEGMLMLCRHDKATFIMPPHLAYGLPGDGDKIPARATIVYEVEVIDVRY